MPRDKGKRRAYHKEYMREYMKRPGVKEKHLRRVKANQKKYRALNQILSAAIAPTRRQACKARRGLVLDHAMTTKRRDGAD